MKIDFRILAVTLIGAALVWAALMAFVPGAKQERLFYADGREMLSDYVMPRQCVAAADPYMAEAVEPKDRCYAALGYAIAAAFPKDNLKGGVVFTLFGAGLFLAAVWILMAKSAASLTMIDRGLMVMAVALSSPFLYNLERGNQVWLAGAGVMLFLAWFEAECRWKRMVALAALAFAGALKITPGIFALLLVKDRRWKDLMILIVFGMALLILPFFLYGGFESVQTWLECMREHMDFYASRKGWGFVKIVRTCSLASFQRLASGGDLLMGLVAVWAFFKSRERQKEVLLLGQALVLAPGVSQYYTALYLMPAVVLLAGRKLTRVEFGLWFVILCSLQLPVGEISLNRTMANLAVMAMGAMEGLRRLRGLRGLRGLRRWRG